MSFTLFMFALGVTVAAVAAILTTPYYAFGFGIGLMIIAVLQGPAIA